MDISRDCAKSTSRTNLALRIRPAPSASSSLQSSDGWLAHEAGSTPSSTEPFWIPGPCGVQDGLPLVQRRSRRGRPELRLLTDALWTYGRKRRPARQRRRGRKRRGAAGVERRGRGRGGGGRRGPVGGVGGGRGEPVGGVGGGRGGRGGWKGCWGRRARGRGGCSSWPGDDMPGGRASYGGPTGRPAFRSLGSWRIQKDLPPPGEPGGGRQPSRRTMSVN